MVATARRVPGVASDVAEWEGAGVVSAARVIS